MRQRREYTHTPPKSRLEIAQARPADEDDDELPGKLKMYTTAKGKKRRRKQHFYSKIQFKDLWARVRHLSSAIWILCKKLLGRGWRFLNGMNTVQILVALVSLLFLGVPLILFAVSERKVIHEHAIHYDIHNCPEKPPVGYPREYPILDLLHYWPTGNLTVPERIHKGICIFDLNAVNGVEDIAIRQKIQRYREAQVPFLIRNDAQMIQVITRFQNNEYLSALLANQHFPVTVASNSVQNGTASTQRTRMSFEEWFEIAKQAHADDQLEKFSSLQVQDSELLNKELPFLKGTEPSSKHNHKSKDHNALLLYDIQPVDGMNMNCHFQSTGFLNELQFNDATGNYIAMVGGKTRFLLAHPRNCPSLYVEPHKDNVTYHSQIHLKNYNHSYPHHNLHPKHNAHRYNHPHHPLFHEYFPDFPDTNMNEVLLEPGDVLFLPTHWFYHSVALSITYQCNSPSGHANQYQSIIHQCIKKELKEMEKEAKYT